MFTISVNAVAPVLSLSAIVTLPPMSTFHVRLVAEVVSKVFNAGAEGWPPGIIDGK